MIIDEDYMDDVDRDDFWEDTYLDHHYDGAPNECGWHYRQGTIIRFNSNGECPRQTEHPDPWY